MKAALALSMVFPFVFTLQTMIPDFGPDGLAGLSAEEKRKLVAEGIVVPEEASITEEGKTMVAAALLINLRVDRVWEVLCRPETQAEYLPEVKKALLLSRRQGEARVRFEVKILGTTTRYTVIHQFFPEAKAITWTLDSTAANDLEEFQGFWRLHSWNGNKTLARYGSRVVPRFGLAKWIIQMLYRRHVRQALLSVKAYLEGLSR